MRAVGEYHDQGHRPSSRKDAQLPSHHNIGLSSAASASEACRRCAVVVFTDGVVARVAR